MAAGGQHPVLVLIILLVWLTGFAFCWRMLKATGVASRAGRAVLGSIPPTAALVAVLHLLGLISLLAPLRCVVPAVILPAFAIVLSFTLLAWRWAVPASVPVPATNAPLIRGPNQPISTSTRWLMLAMAIVAGTHAVFLLDAATRYPAGCDALNYHLPAAARWVQDGALSLNDRDWRLSMAANGELPSMLVLFAGVERLLPVLPVPLGLLTAAALYDLARRWGGGRRGAMSAALLALGLPLVMYHMYANYVDLFGASAWLASIVAITWAQRTTGRARVCLWLVAGLAAGLAAGTRLTFAVFAGLSGALLMASTLADRRSGGARRAFRAGVCFSLASVCCCWFWPVRAAVMTGNPIHPIAWQQGRLTMGTTPLDSIYGHSSDGEWLSSRTLPQRLLAAAAMPWREYQYGSGYRYSVDGGTGAAYAMLVPIGLSIILLRALRRGGRSDAVRWQLLAGALLATGLLLHVTAFRMYTRYSLGFVLLAIPLAAIWANRFIARWPRTAPALLALACAITGAMAAVAPARALAGRVIHGDWSRSAYYEIPAILDDLPEGTVVVNAGGTPDNYSLLGRRLGNRVITAVEWRNLIESGRPFEELLRLHRVEYLYISGTLPPAAGAKPLSWPENLPVSCVSELRRDHSTPDNVITRVFRVEPGTMGVAVR